MVGSSATNRKDARDRGAADQAHARKRPKHRTSIHALLISGSKVRVLDGPPITSRGSRSSGPLECFQPAGHKRLAVRGITEIKHVLGHARSPCAPTERPRRRDCRGRAGILRIGTVIAGQPRGQRQGRGPYAVPIRKGRVAGRRSVSLSAPRLGGGDCRALAGGGDREGSRGARRVRVDGAPGR